MNLCLGSQTQLEKMPNSEPRFDGVTSVPRERGMPVNLYLTSNACKSVSDLDGSISGPGSMVSLVVLSGRL